MNKNFFNRLKRDEIEDDMHQPQQIELPKGRFQLSRLPHRFIRCYFPKETPVKDLLSLLDNFVFNSTNLIKTCGDLKKLIDDKTIKETDEKHFASYALQMKLMLENKLKYLLHSKEMIEIFNSRTGVDVLEANGQPIPGLLRKKVCMEEWKNSDSAFEVYVKSNYDRLIPDLTEWKETSSDTGEHFCFVRNPEKVYPSEDEFKDHDRLNTDSSEEEETTQQTEEYFCFVRNLKKVYLSEDEFKNIIEYKKKKLNLADTLQKEYSNKKLTELLPELLGLDTRQTDKKITRQRSDQNDTTCEYCSNFEKEHLLEINSPVDEVLKEDDTGEIDEEKATNLLFDLLEQLKCLNLNNMRKKNELIALLQKKKIEDELWGREKKSIDKEIKELLEFFSKLSVYEENGKDIPEEYIEETSKEFSRKINDERKERHRMKQELKKALSSIEVVPHINYGDHSFRRLFKNQHCPK